MSSTIDKLRDRERVFGTTITQFSWPWIIPGLQKTGLDFVLIEMEHSALDWRDLEGLLRMCDTVGLTSIVRVTDHVYHQVSRALDLGADGILLPRTQTLAQVEEAIDMMRLPPRGRKGVGGYDFSTSDFAARADTYNNEKMIIAQIESPQGISNLDAMIKTGELSGVIVGPSDLSVSLGRAGQYDHPDVVSAIEEVIAICAAQQLSCGMFMGGIDHIAHWCAKGMNIIWTGSDVGFLLSGVKSLRTAIDQIP